MVSMTLASLGWGTWWVLLFTKKLFGVRPESLFVPSLISTVFAVTGLVYALWCIRAQRSWLVFVMIPILANLSLLFLPWFADELTSKTS